MLFAGPRQTSFTAAAGILAPAGAVVAYSGTIASIPAGWSLCDGTNGTPDLRDRMVIGAGGAHALGATGGAATGQAAGTSSTDGVHSGTNNGIDQGVANPPGGGNGSDTLADGNHSHVVTGDMAPWQPPACNVVYIRAAAAAKLPAAAILHTVSSSSLPAYAAAAGRWLVGVGGDDRGQMGSLDKTVTMHTAADGYHSHGGGNYSDPMSCSGTIYEGAANTSSLHIHDDTDAAVTVDPPPYVALLVAVTSAETGVPAGYILAYDGLPGDLPPEWALCDGAGGTPDLRDRMPVGADATYPAGTTGGSLAALPLSGSLPSKDVVHGHQRPNPYATNRCQRNAWHYDQSWVHCHTYTATLDPTPPYHALHYILSL